MSRMIHGTQSMYTAGHCRCFDCTVAASDVALANYRRKGGWAAEEGAATRGEVREWVASIGFTIPASMYGKKAEALIARYNREHPDRPYIRPSDGGATS